MQVKPTVIGAPNTLVFVEPWVERWADLIRQVVEERGSQEKAAAYLGYHQTAIGKWMKGRSAPVLTAVQHVLERLDLPIEYLALQGAGRVPYRDHVRSGSGTGKHRIVYQALAEYAETEEWKGLPLAHQRTLRELRVHGAEPTVDFYRGLAVLLLTRTRATGVSGVG